jgi:putative membrane protein
VTANARYPATLLAFLLVWTVMLGIAPHYRQDWLLENMLLALALPVLVLTYRDLRFSDFAYTCLFVFFLLHEVGSHYTYSLVPYDRWSLALLGTSLDGLLGFERNQFDRAVHFLYGVLVTPAVVELFAAKAPPVGVWRFLMPLFFMNAHAVIYETIEWLAAEAFGGELGVAYLGTQGDPFDAQKDMALAFLGTLLSLSVLLWRRRVRTRALRGSS